MPELHIAIGEIAADFERLLAEIPDMRRGLHEELAGVAKSEVNASIGGTGKVQGWQERIVGSGGGYAAVRPIKTPSGKGGPGAVTNAIEHGHKIRLPGGKANRYRPRVKVAHVSGRFFYQKAEAGVEAKAIAAAEAFCDKLAARLEGGG